MKLPFQWFTSSSPTDQDLDPEYVSKYRRSHDAPDSCAYRVDYWKIGLADYLLSDYRYLDIGCGTGGYFRLLSGAKMILGIDRSPAMIAAAEDLARKSSYGAITSFHLGEFSSLRTDKEFDLIRLGVFGTYEPLTLDVLSQAEALLSADGLLIASFMHTNRLIANTVNREIFLSKRRLQRLLSRHGEFKILIDWHTRNGYVAFLSRRAK